LPPFYNVLNMSNQLCTPLSRTDNYCWSCRKTIFRKIFFHFLRPKIL